MKRDRPKQLHLSMLDKKLAETVVVYLPGGRSEAFQVKGSAVTQRLVRFINTMVLPATPDILDGANLNRVRLGTGEDFKEMEFQGDLWLNYYLGSMVFKILRRMYGQRRWTRTISGHLSGCVRSNAVFSMLGFRIGLALSPTSKSTADRFEAMVHGLRQDANKSQLEPWIEKIFTPLIEEGCLVVAQRLPGNPQRIDLSVPSGSQIQPAYHEDDDGYIIIDDDSDDETEIIEVLSAASGTDEAEVAKMLARPSASPPPPSSTQELYNYKATVIDVYPDSIRVNVPKLGERAYFGVELARCAQAVESYKHNPHTNQLEIVWKAAAGEDEEDDEIQMDCFTSAIAVGCSTRVWVPYRDMKLDRKADTTLVHPWDRRATLTVEQIS